MTEKPKRKFKKFTKAEREAIGLDKVPDTMYDTRLYNPDTQRLEEWPQGYDPREEPKS